MKTVKFYEKQAIKAITTDRNKLIAEVKNAQNMEYFRTWWIEKYLTPTYKTKIKKNLITLQEIKDYTVKRIVDFNEKKIIEKIKRIKDIFNAPDLLDFSLTVEWINSRNWGANAKAEIKIHCINKEKENSYFHHISSTASGCGYCKESTAFADACNQNDSILKLLFKLGEKDKKNLYGFSKFRDCYIPHLSGGVGVSCYYSIFQKLGYKLEKVSSGKMHDSYICRKYKKNNI